MSGPQTNVCGPLAPPGGIEPLALRLGEPRIKPIYRVLMHPYYDLRDVNASAVIYLRQSTKINAVGQCFQ